jgi:hypothetical protein
VPGLPVTVTLCAEPLPVVQSGRLLGVHITAGRQAQLLASGTLERLKTAVTAIVRRKRAVKIHQRHPRYAWRRAMLHKFIRPLAEFGMALVTWTPELHSAALRYDRHAAEFVLGHNTRMHTGRIQAIFRLQGAELRCRWLAT